jgi:repressor LexA
MKRALTKKQDEVLRFIRSRLVCGKPAPTIREIGSRFGFSSTGTVRGHLRALAAKGRVVLAASKARSIELAEAAGIPVLGRISAGLPLEAQEDVEGFLRPEELAPCSDDMFALRVQGDSMSGAGILDGDLVVVRRQKQAACGDIVVALVAGEATVKRLCRRQGRLWLAAENPRYRPLACTEATSIIGRVLSVVRRYV